MGGDEEQLRDRLVHRDRLVAETEPEIDPHAARAESTSASAWRFSLIRSMVTVTSPRFGTTSDNGTTPSRKGT